MISKVYRFFFDYKRQLFSKLRIIHLKNKYPKLQIKGNSYIGKNCQIICEDGGELCLDNVYINDGTLLRSCKGAEIRINSSYIGMNCVIAATSKIIIEAHCEIAEMVVIRDQNHIHKMDDTPISKHGFKASPITIGKNVWIGAKATVLEGVNIGKNSVVGAHALVNKSVDPGTINVGIPAKKLI